MKKRILALLPAIALLLCLVACTSSEPPADEGGARIIEPSVAGASMAGRLWDSFLSKITADEDMTAEALATALVENPVIRFDGMVSLVEPGLLLGFDNYEVTGFRSGAMFGPKMGSIAFVGYVFELEDGTDVAGFVDGLKKNANLNWQVCVSAGQLAVGAYGSTVFFVMCPGGTV